jgi:hypothetical protein
MIGPMNKGYAFGFLIVLLVLILGLYVAFTGFMSSREALRAQPVAQPATEAGETDVAPPSPSPTPRPTILTIPTPVPGETVTLTVATVAIVVETPAPAGSPAVQSTEPPAVQPTDPPAAQPTATAGSAAPATPGSVPAYQFRLAGPASPDSSYPICCYLFGTVRDAGGVPLEGVQVQAFNEWQSLPPAATKGGGEAGQYNIPIGRDKVIWYVVVVDASGTSISTQSPVAYDPDVAHGYRVDWQRTY